MSLARTLVLLAAALGCQGRGPSRDAGLALGRDATVAPADGAGAVRPGPLGPWKAAKAEGAAYSEAVRGRVLGEVFGAVALPSEDLSCAEMRWSRWDEHGAAVVATRTTKGMAPGAAMALVRRAEGYAVVWHPPPDADGGVAARAIDVTATGFAGDERDATQAEVEAASWARDAMVPRRRMSASDPGLPVTQGPMRLRVEMRRALPVLLLDDVEVTSGVDLLGYENSLGLGVADDRRWVAVSRGHCRQTRVEVFRVDGDRAELRGRFLMGAEVGVRWIRIDGHRDEAVVTWYQDLIPIRLDCARGPRAATVADHGGRVGMVLAEGAAPPPVPVEVAGDAGPAGADAALDGD